MSVPRREFLGALMLPVINGVAPEALLSTLRPAALPDLALLAATPGEPEAVAQDESFWFQVQQAFQVDRSLINLNNGGVSPAPRTVLDAVKRELDFTNRAPAHTLWTLQAPQKESVRGGLARCFGAHAEEIAITRNASEALQILQLGLPLNRGDEVVTSTQDYPRMLTTFEQRERRDGIVLKQVQLPVPCEEPEEIVRRFEAALSPRTRMILISHVINLTGQILPVRELVALGRRRGIPVLVDGAHAFAHIPFTRDELDCDFYATSLHKWLFAPIGTGLLYVRRERIGELWPLMAAPKTLDHDIRKFEEIGTHPMAPILAIADALLFHSGLGAERKAARLRYLRDRWARPLAAVDGVSLLTSLDPRFSCGLATVRLDRVPVGALQQALWNEHRIYTVGIKHAEFEGLRVSPSVYTTLGEIDRFTAVMCDYARRGLPAAAG